ncbi:Threonine/homoserine efflux transporter RhtA [Lysobacter sp. yr284]|uniref:DMT family transporter n=1 Tax=Lysobacter sp. yr284 TaxID=1761791 RepID=UPI000899C5BE|nr:DMT family transporter [Lysobacter sp. yr284]SDY90552.1 Threonine/homoserine efflux transporter RhtA [Lysobacter sp. yr284]
MNAALAPTGFAARLRLDALELPALAAIWGISFLFMRVAAPAFGPLALVEVRLALGGLVLAPLLWRARAQFPLRLWPKLALVGAINSAVPFALFAWGAERAPAGIGAIASAMTVLFAALVGFAFFGEKIGKRRALALLGGFAGVGVLAAGKSGGTGAAVGWAVAAGCAAAFLYGVGLHLVRRHLGGLPPAAVASATLLSAALLMLPAALAQWPAQPVGARAWAAAALLGLLCTGLAYALFYRLVARIGAARTSLVTYLIPLFGVAWAWLLLGEPVTAPMAAAGALILAGVWLARREAH